MHSADLSPAALVAGGAPALATLFDAHRARLRRAVEVRMAPELRHRLDPDDVLQEAWLAATQRLAGLPESGLTPFLWLRRLVGQVLVDAHRRHVKAAARNVRRETAMYAGPPAVGSALLANQLAASITSPSQAATRHELQVMVVSALERLEPIDREVLVLRHLEGLDNSEVAELLVLSKTAASNRYVRALARLRELLPMDGSGG